jgi:hypothetical protein
MRSGRHTDLEGRSEDVATPEPIVPFQSIALAETAIGSFRSTLDGRLSVVPLPTNARPLPVISASR